MSKKPIKREVRFREALKKFLTEQHASVGTTTQMEHGEDGGIEVRYPEFYLYDTNESIVIYD